MRALSPGRQLGARSAAAIAVLAAVSLQVPVNAFHPPAVALAVSPANSDALVDISFPPDGIELAMLADIVTRRLHIPILYDEQLRNKRVTVRVPARVPESALMGILQSALRMKGMALVDAEAKGWKQIVIASNLAAVAPLGNAQAGEGPVAEVFTLAHADAGRLSELVRPFLTQPGGYVQGQAGQRTLIVGDYSSAVRRIETLVKQLDTDVPPLDTKFVSLKTISAGQALTTIQQILNNRDQIQFGNSVATGIYLTADEATNQLIIVAAPARLAEVLELVDGLDKGQPVEAHLYRLSSVSPERVDQVIRGVVDPALLKRGYQAQLDHESQTLVVSATPAIQSRVADIVKQLDMPAAQESNPIQFYKLKNSKAAELLSTIGGVLGDSGTGPTTLPAVATASNSRQESSGYGNGGSGFSRTMDSSTAGVGGTQPSAFGGNAGGNGGGGGSSLGNRSDLQNASPILAPAGSGSSQAGQAGVLAVHGRGATAMADVNTNSIIVVGPPSVQQIYADLIHRLDQRRPQVQVECTVVTLDTTNNFSLGVDIGRLGGSNGSELLTLSTFGVSTADPKTGRLTPTAGTGGTFALLSPKIADVVVRALETDSKARLVSAPRLLVNDNGRGQLQSVAQEPYAVILDASSTQSLTSLGGLAQAGTTISVEPHISEADYLQLGYSIELSNFTGASSGGLPPPSQKNSVDSEVTIPDGYTIVVGGLNSRNYTEATNTIPILGQIPVLNLLFGSRSKHSEETTLFVFIRPTILRDDQFEDLKLLSAQNLHAAGLTPNAPKSEPIPMK